jgi:hypothetical protein
MRISDKLNFQGVGNTFTHSVRCCNCDRQDLPQNWQIASLFPFNDNSDLNYIVCSDACRQAFLSHENLDVHVMLDVVQAAERLNKSLSPEFKKILLSISN